jgi:WD40 repeat protein
MDFSGCVNAKDSDIPKTPLITPEKNSIIQSATPTIHITQMQIWTNTPVPSVIETVLPPTSTWTSTPQLIENKDEILECSGRGLPQSPNIEFSLPGTIIYLDDSGAIYYLGGAPLKQASLVTDEQGFDVFGVSPDGEWLAYSQKEPSTDIAFPVTRTLTLLSSGGEKIEQTLDITEFLSEIADDEHLDGFNENISYWINNNLIYTAIDTAKTNPSGPITSHDLIKIFDPFAAQWKNNILNTLPNWSSYWEMEDNSVALSPDLSRAMYMSDSGLVLRDLEKEFNLWTEVSYMDKLYSGVLMRWNPDGTLVAVAPWNWFGDQAPPLVMTRDGMEQRWIGNEEFPYTYGPSFVRALSWSPDGKMLALAGLSNQSNNIEPYIYIYDYQTNQFVFRCPIVRKEGDLPQKIIWSPDGNYLAYAFLDYPEGNPLQVMDLRSGELFELAQNAKIVGWSYKFPVELP